MIGLTEILNGLRPQADARCGSRSARPATAPTPSFTRSRSAQPSGRITSPSRSSSTTCGAARARTSSSAFEKGRAKRAWTTSRSTTTSSSRSARCSPRRRPGDVVGVTALGMRPEIFAWLDANDAERLTPKDIRRIVGRARASRAPAGLSTRPVVGVSAPVAHRMQSGAHGIASSRSGEIASPHRSHNPYVPSASLRSRVPRRRGLRRWSSPRRPCSTGPRLRSCRRRSACRTRRRPSDRAVPR